MKKSASFAVGVLLVALAITAFAATPSKYRQLKTMYDGEVMGNCIFSTIYLYGVSDDSFTPTTEFSCGDEIYARCYFPKPINAYKAEAINAFFDINGSTYSTTWPADATRDAKDVLNFKLDTKKPEEAINPDAKDWISFLCRDSKKPSPNAEMSLTIKVKLFKGYHKEIAAKEGELVEESYRDVDYLPIASGSFIMKVSDKKKR